MFADVYGTLNQILHREDREKILLAEVSKDYDIEVNRELLAYLWAAIECRMNIVVAGESRLQRIRFLKLLIALIPPYSNTLIVGRMLKAMPSRSNLISVSIRNPISDPLLLIKETDFLPDGIMAEDIETETGHLLFKASNLGIQSICSIDSEGLPARIIDSAKNQLKIEYDLLNCIDISVSLSGADNAIEEIYEYNWLSRAEIQDDAQQPGDYTLPIALGKSLIKENLQRSKAVHAYSAINLVGRKTAMKEIACRTSFLRKTFRKAISLNSALESIERYYEIK